MFVLVGRRTEDRWGRGALLGLSALAPGALWACISFDGLTGGSADGGLDSGRVPDSGVESADCGAFAEPGASTLVDTFDGSTLSPNWSVPGVPCGHQINGALVAQPANDYCFFVTKQSYHLTCDQLAFEVPQVTTQAKGIQTTVTLGSKGDDVTIIILENGGFQFNGVAFQGGGYDPVQDRWWRLRERGGVLYFDTSPDGLSWNERVSTPDPIPLDEVTVALAAGEYIPDAGPAGEAEFRCYNSFPPACQ